MPGPRRQEQCWAATCKRSLELKGTVLTDEEEINLEEFYVSENIQGH